jgi:hypothetical protein
MAVNDIAGAQNVILKELEKEFGGAAKAARWWALGPAATRGSAWQRLREIRRTHIRGIAPLIGYVERLVTWLGSLDDSTKTVLLVIGGLAAAIGPCSSSSERSLFPSQASSRCCGGRPFMIAMTAVGTVLTGPVGIAIAIGVVVAALTAFALKNEAVREALGAGGRDPGQRRQCAH